MAIFLFSFRVLTSERGDLGTRAPDFLFAYVYLNHFLKVSLLFKVEQYFNEEIIRQNIYNVIPIHIIKMTILILFDKN